MGVEGDKCQSGEKAERWLDWMLFVWQVTLLKFLLRLLFRVPNVLLLVIYVRARLDVNSAYEIVCKLAWHWFRLHFYPADWLTGWLDDWLPSISHQRIDWHMITASSCHSHKAFILAPSIKHKNTRHRKQKPQNALKCTAKYAPNCIQALTPISRLQQWLGIGEAKGKRTFFENTKKRMPTNGNGMCKASSEQGLSQGLHLAPIFIF